MGNIEGWGKFNFFIIGIACVEIPSLQPIRRDLKVTATKFIKNLSTFGTNRSNIHVLYCGEGFYYYPGIRMLCLSEYEHEIYHNTNIK
jgi:hypothetical protein